MRHAGQSVTGPCCWKGLAYHFDPQTNVIDVHISRLRAKADKGLTAYAAHCARRGYS